MTAVIAISLISIFFISLSFISIVNGQRAHNYQEYNYGNYTYQNINSFTKQLMNDCSVVLSANVKPRGMIEALQQHFSDPKNNTGRYSELCVGIMDSIDKTCKGNITKFDFCTASDPHRALYK